jgi:hypothetical protein
MPWRQERWHHSSVDPSIMELTDQQISLRGIPGQYGLSPPPTRALRLGIDRYNC